jgi:uncharacterized membrane protein YkvA (DUF1232 family)
VCKALYLGEVAPVDHEKYKALYDYQKDQFESESGRFNRLEDKAVRYLTSITVAVSAYILLVRWSADKIIPPSGFLDWLVVISIVFTIISMASSWSFIFRSIKLQDLMKMPAGNEVSDLFHENERATVYLSLSRRYSEAAKEKERQYNLKLKNVRKGYSEIVFSGWCFLISISLIFANVWMEG